MAQAWDLEHGRDDIHGYLKQCFFGCIEGYGWLCVLLIRSYLGLSVQCMEQEVQIFISISFAFNYSLLFTVCTPIAWTVSLPCRVLIHGKRVGSKVQHFALTYQNRQFDCLANLGCLFQLKDFFFPRGSKSRPKLGEG